MNTDKFPTEKKLFEKVSRVEAKEFKNAGYPFYVDGENFENGHFETADVIIIFYDFSGSVAFSNFVRISVDRKRFIRFWPKPL